MCHEKAKSLPLLRNLNQPYLFLFFQKSLVQAWPHSSLQLTPLELEVLIRAYAHFHTAADPPSEN